MSSEGAPWWKSAVFYQIYPRSFADSTGSGIGDLRGIADRLDHLTWLGIDALWISPFYPSPMRDFGYDVSNYCDVAPEFGTLADFDHLIEEAHARDLRVIIDWVPAHSSSDHPWFVEARSSRSNPRREWYVWRDPGPNGELPNNWVSTFTRGRPAWTLDATTEQLYLHSFLPEQPDLNWANPDVVAAMHDTLRFWLDRGVDGFRADVIHNIGKDPELADADPKLAKIPHCALNDVPETHPLLKDIRRLIDSYPQEPVVVGEVFLLSTEQVAAYYGSQDELHLNFNFPPLFAPWDASKWRACIETTRSALDPVEAWPTWVLSNHDQPRHRTRYGSEARARAAAMLLLTLRGTPFLYMGEELGLEDAVIPPDRVVDPGGRDGCRAPIPWEPSPPHGWGSDPWLPFAPMAELRNPASLREEPDSMAQLYRRILGARRASPALQLGEMTVESSPDGLLVYRRTHGEDRRMVVINFRDESAELDLDGRWSIEVASDAQSEGRIFGGEVASDQALILR